MFATLCCAALLLSADAADAVRAQGPERRLAIQPDARMQAELDRVIETLLSRSATPEERFCAIGTLREPSRKDREAFVRQLFYCYCRVSPGKNGEEAGILLMSMVMMLRVHPSVVAKEVTPYLDDKDEVLRRSAESFLRRTVETGRPPGVHDFSYYEGLLGRDAPLPLVGYMYRRSPDTAFLTLASVYASAAERRDFVWAEHVISDAIWRERKGFVKKGDMQPEAIAQLEKHARHGAWWARLYVAEIMRCYPELRRPQLIAQLKDDKHPLVQKTMDRVLHGDPKLRGAPTKGGVVTPAQEKPAQPQGALEAPQEPSLP